jgi:hypothetical protein
LTQLRGKRTTDDIGRPVLQYDTSNIDTSGDVRGNIKSIIGPGIAKVINVFDYSWHMNVWYQDFGTSNAMVVMLDKKIAKILDDLELEQNNAELYAGLANVLSYSSYKSPCLKINIGWIKVLDAKDRSGFIDTVDGMNAIDYVRRTPGGKYDHMIYFKSGLESTLITSSKKIIFNLLRTIVSVKLRKITDTGI